MAGKGIRRRENRPPFVHTKEIAILFGFFYFAFVNPVIPAQNLRVIGVPAVRVYIFPMESGTPEEQEYFMEAMEMEFAGATYQVVDTIEDSDYNVRLAVSREGGSASSFNITLFDTKSGREVVSVGRDYREVAEMEDWNLFLITQAMANLPIVRIPPGAELLAVPEGGASMSTAYKPGFYLGLRAGGHLNTFTFQTSGDYEPGLRLAFSGEGAVLAEFRIARLLSLQAEAIFIYNAFEAGKKTQNGVQVIHSTDTFWHLSLMFPLLIKVPVEVGRFTLSPFAGGYYTMALGPMNRVDEDGGTYSYNMDLPFGISLGIDMGLVLGPGEIFVGLRFDQDLGITTAEGRNGPQYSRNRIGLSLGYEFLLGKKRR